MPSVANVLAVKAMDGLYLRAAAIAENIANLGSSAYRVKSVDFEAELARAAAAGSDALAAYEPTARSAAVASAGDEIRLDLEMAAASSTAGRFAALSDLLNRQMQIGRIAVRGGQ